jgi:hypothetical protein
MSERNGDRARFQKNRKSKLLRRQRIHAFVAALRKKTDGASGAETSLTTTPTDAASVGASRVLPDRGGTTRTGE